MQSGIGFEAQSQLEDRAGRDIVMSARQKAQSYKFDQYVDLVDFCHQLKNDTRCSEDVELKKLLWTVRAAIETS